MSTIRLKRSSVSGKIPTTTDLELGEVAINTHDGDMFIKKDDGVETIVQVAMQDADVSFASATFTDITDVDSIQFDTNTAIGTATGMLAWNADDGTLDLGMEGNVINQIGQEVLYRVRNNTASIIPNGTAVMATGTLGASGRVTVAPMVADGSVESRYFMGVATGDIPVDSDGYVTHFGKVRGVDFRSFNEGDLLWLDPSNPGDFTNVEPTAPNLKINTAIVVANTTNGTILVRANQGTYLRDGNDVSLSSVTDNQFLVYSSSNEYWENRTANTSIISEGTNLYYTVARANTAIDARVTKTFVDALNVDADTLDGVQGSNYARTDINETFNGSVTIDDNHLQIKGSTYTDFSDFWSSGPDNRSIFTPLGYIGSNGAFRLSIFSNGYRNDTGGFTTMGINGNANASGIELDPSGSIFLRGGTPSGTAPPTIVTFSPENASFETDITFNNNALISDWISNTNIDHIWHDDSNDSWNFVSDGSYKSPGNSVLVASRLQGSADTLTTARTISLGGDVSGSASFDGSQNITITATVADDSHNHIISNIDGLQTALNGKVDEAVNVIAGAGLTGGGALSANVTISHADTSTQSSVNNSNGTVIQDITLDTYGHITSIGSVNLDSRYYTESEADSRFVNATGDTMTGRLIHDDNTSDGTAGFLATGGGLGGKIASFVRDVGTASDIRVHISGLGGDPQIDFLKDTDAFSMGFDGSSFVISNGGAISVNPVFEVTGAAQVSINENDPITGSALLHISNDARGQTAPIPTLVLEAHDVGTTEDVSVGVGPSIDFYVPDETGARKGRSQLSGRISCIMVNAGDASGAGALVFSTALNNSTLVEAFRINPDTTSTFAAEVSAPNFNTTSDRNMKENIEPISNAIDTVISIEGVTFNFKEKEGRHVGVIAQNVEKALPEAVSEDANGNKTVAYGNMVGLLIEAIKEQQKQIEELKSLLTPK